MAGSNGAGPSVGVPADSTGVFGRVGAELPLGERRFRVRILTNRQIKEQMPLLNALQRNVYGDSVGEQFYAAALNSDGWEPLAAWLNLWVVGDITEDVLLDASTEEVTTLIDTIFEQSGLAWLGRSLGNGAAATRRALEAAQSAPLAFPPTRIVESDSTPSTSSSSESPGLPPTPESTSPSTD